MRMSVTPEDPQGWYNHETSQWDKDQPDMPDFLKSDMASGGCEKPILPYAGTSGWSGSDASRERAEERDSSGKTGQLQARVWAAVGNYGISGTTIKRLREIFPGEHHGTLSGALTALHKGGKIARLTEKRDRCSIYVLPEYVNGREVAQPSVRPRPVPEWAKVMVEWSEGDDPILDFKGAEVPERVQWLLNRAFGTGREW